MGTANFCYKDKLFVVETDGDEHDRDDIIEMLGNDLYELLAQLDKNAVSKNKKITISVTNESRPTWSKSDDNRNFSAKHHGNIIIRSEFLGLPLEVDLEVLVRNGYYDHVNIDYNVGLYVDGSDYDYDSDAYDIMDSYDTDDINDGMRAMQRQNFDNRLDAMRELADELFTHIGRSVATQYGQGASASNGETGYHAVENTAIKFDHLKIAA